MFFVEATINNDEGYMKFSMKKKFHEILHH